MSNLIVFGLLVVLLVAAQFASAKTVDEVIEKYIHARGGKYRLDAVQSIYMEGVREMAGNAATIKITREQDKLSRTEIDNGYSKNLVLITGKVGWTFLQPGSMRANQIIDGELMALQTEMDIAGPLVNYIEKGHRAELLGKEVTEGNRCYKIRLTTGAGQEMMFWIDTATWLLNQASGVSVTDDSCTVNETLTLYRHYIEVDGIKFAHTCETKTKGADQNSIAEEITFHQILLNPAVDPKLFLPEL